MVIYNRILQQFIRFKKEKMGDLLIDAAAGLFVEGTFGKYLVGFGAEMITMTPSDSLDIIRTLRMAGYALIILGTTQHLFQCSSTRYITLSRSFIIPEVPKLCWHCGFNSLPYIAQGRVKTYRSENGEEIAVRLKRDLIPTMTNGLMYWPLCDFLAYKVVPVHLQPLVNSSFSYAWTIYLTYVANLKKFSD
ncbi:uncharacterized protein [Solanum tuberosum]|uniref:uncharacterized protein n=1 Tax=Solanum tuberosum TaxID=4113 RepID=UPI00073A048C|nr:PREDICTED: uncharacterized protein LOC107057814 [Solanum tuberosum]